MTKTLNNRSVIIIGVVCVAILLGVIINRAMVNKETTNQVKINNQSKEYNSAVLLKYKTPYVGDNSKVINLIDNLPLASYRKEVSLETNRVPFGISVNYDFAASSLSLEAIKSTLKDNAIVMFALVDNVDVINFNLGEREDQKYQLTRTQIQQSYSQDLRQYSKDGTTLDTLLNSFR